jgi:hypothetical protein
MLANLLAHTIPNLNKFILSIIRISMRQQRITIKRINVPKHRTPQVRDIIHLEQPIPTTHPRIAISVKHKHFILWFLLSAGLGGRCLSAADVLKRHLVAVLGDPVEATVFFVGEESGGSVFVQTS